MLPKVDPETIEIAFTQEKFDAAVERARVARHNLAVAKGNHRTAKRFLDDAEEEANRAKMYLVDLARAAAGYGRYE